MRVGIMQPYLFPYIGYFQLMNAVDEFVLYDNIEYTKKGWINRNRILVNGKDTYISLPLKKDSDFLYVKERYLSESWLSERKKLLNRISESYKKAPYFQEAYPLLQTILMFEDFNLFNFLYHSIKLLKEYFEIHCSITISSDISVDHNLKSENKVIAICRKRSADVYINAIGGQNLYNNKNFRQEGIDLYFIKMNPFEYKQFNNDFIPFLSIIDVMMFNEKAVIKEFLNTGYILI